MNKWNRLNDFMKDHANNIIGNDHSLPDVNPTTRDTPVNPTPRDIPVNPTPRDIPVNPTSRDTPVNPTPRDTPVNPTTRDTPVNNTPCNPTSRTSTSRDSTRQYKANDLSLNKVHVDTPGPAHVTNPNTGQDEYLIELTQKDMADGIDKVMKYTRHPHFAALTAQPPVKVFVKQVIVNNTSFQSHVKGIDELYEDVLPEFKGELIFMTLVDRLAYHAYASSLQWFSASVSSILSRIKLTRINNPHGPVFNPYKQIGTDCIVYDLQYPIKKGVDGVVVPVNNAIDMHIRLYPSIGELQSNHLTYYNIINEVCGKHSNPHFVMMYTHAVVNNSLHDPVVFGDNTKPAEITAMLTESSGQTLKAWTSNQYHFNNGINKMINAGMHDVRDWINVLFQITSVCYTLLKHGMDIGFTIDNFLIKSLPTKNIKGVEYWEYVIDNINYYLPYRGLVVLFDLSPDSEVYYTPVVTHTYYTEMIDPHTLFSPKNVQNGVCKPPDVVIEFMTKLADTSNISDALRMFDMYYNNRIGTLLSTQDVSTVIMEPLVTDRLIKGKLYACMTRPQVYTWLMYTGSGMFFDGKEYIRYRGLVLDTSTSPKQLYISEGANFSVNTRLDIYRL